MQISSLIIDDERLARQRIENLLNDVPEINVIGHCKNGKEAIQKIEELSPSLIFLDIQMKDMTGFEVLEKLSSQKKPIIIFVTAYDEFALKAFDYFAFDYLMKPFKDDRFYKSLEKVIYQYEKHDFSIFQAKIDHLVRYIQEPSSKTQTISTNKLPIKLGNKVSFINTSEIKYILASGYYAEVYTSEKKHLLRESLSNLINRLVNSPFIRIHRSTIINVGFMSEVVHSNYGEVDVKMNDGKLLRISKGYKKDFQNSVGLK